MSEDRFMERFSAHALALDSRWFDVCLTFAASAGVKVAPWHSGGGIWLLRGELAHGRVTVLIGGDDGGLPDDPNAKGSWYIGLEREDEANEIHSPDPVTMRFDGYSGVGLAEHVGWMLRALDEGCWRTLPHPRRPDGAPS